MSKSIDAMCYLGIIFIVNIFLMFFSNEKIIIISCLFLCMILPLIFLYFAIVYIKELNNKK